MYIHGHFYNERNDRIEVHILTRGDRSHEVEIGNGGEIDWTDDPVDITSEVGDTFDVLLCHQASVRLLVRNFVPDFFCASCRDAVVNICRDGKCLFAGFVEPQTYSQGYNEEQDEIELSCIDVLTAMQYAKYGNVGALGVQYGAVKASAGQRAMLDIIRDIMADMTDGLDLAGGLPVRCLYDGSRAIDDKPENRHAVFGQLAVNELLFLGSEEDEVWQQDEVLEEMLKYLNLHIVQDGLTFYVFSWESVKGAGGIGWRDMFTGERVPMSRRTVDIATRNVTGTDTTISVGEVYNRIWLTCKIESVESVIESPLDDDLLKSPYRNKQKYMTEYSADGNGTGAIDAFDAITHDRPTDYEHAKITDWFVRVRDNMQWSFPRKGNGDLITLYCSGGRNQHALLDVLGSEPGTAIIALGKVERESVVKDNSPVSKVSMTNYLVVSVNGNGEDKDENEVYPNEASLKENIPCAVYKGNTTGGVFSPSDENTVNYIVLSGRMVLNPVMEVTDTFKAIRDYNPSSVSPSPGYGIRQWWHRTVPSRNNTDGRYYTRRWWRAETPDANPQWNEDMVNGLVPFTETGPEEYEFQYSAVGDKSDRVSKVGVLACMLIIGDKCVVEKQPGEDLGTGIPGTGNGQIEDFVWMPYRTLEQCASEDEYYRQSFTVGFNPKIGDKLIGTKFDLQNNIGYEMGVDAEGTAIPIRKADKVSGRVKFMILGPVNLTWDVITRRHPTFFRHTKWSTGTIPLLAHVGGIFVEEFEVKVYSDNGLADNTGDNDLVYMSDTKEQFVHVKDDVEFRISSALTAEEGRALNVTDSVKMSTPLNLLTGDGVLTLYDHLRKESGKPEQCYVDSYYKEYHEPRVLMVQKLVDASGGIVDMFAHYRHPSMSKTFFVQAVTRNIESGEAEITLKEIEQ